MTPREDDRSKIRDAAERRTTTRTGRAKARVESFGSRGTWEGNGRAESNEGMSREQFQAVSPNLTAAVAAKSVEEERGRELGRRERPLPRVGNAIARPRAIPRSRKREKKRNAKPIREKAIAKAQRV